MIFKFLEKPIVIKSILPESYAFVKEMFPITPSHKFIPTHWRKTPKSSFNWEKMRPDTTVKSCSGIINTFTNGFIMPLWSDLAIKIENNDYHTFFSDRISKIGVHSNDQFPNFYDDHLFFKVTSPWYFVGNKEFKMALLDPFYTQNKLKPYVMPYGITSSLNKKITTNFFMFVKKEQTNFLIKSGTPIVQILFLTEKNVKIEPEVVTQHEYNKLNSVINAGLFSSFVNKRAKYLDNLKKFGGN